MLLLVQKLLTASMAFFGRRGSRHAGPCSTRAVRSSHRSSKSATQRSDANRKRVQKPSELTAAGRPDAADAAAERGCMSDFPIRSRKGGANPYVSSDANMPETKPPREPGAAYVFVPTLAACALLLLYVGVGVVTGSLNGLRRLVRKRFLRERIKGSDLEHSRDQQQPL